MFFYCSGILIGLSLYFDQFICFNHSDLQYVSMTFFSEVSCSHHADVQYLCSFHTISQISSFPLSSIPKPVLTKSAPLTPYLPLPVVESPLDFSSPAQFTPCLDTSAARHRMSVKPRNQRASTKKKLATVSD